MKFLKVLFSWFVSLFRKVGSTQPPANPSVVFELTEEDKIEPEDVLQPVKLVVEDQEKDMADPGQLTKNFHIDEFSCNDGAKTSVPKKYMSNVKKVAKNLQAFRDAVGGKVITITSGYRTPEYNKKVGGVKTSQHMEAKAADIKVKGMSSKRVAEKIKELIKEGKMDKGGVGLYKTFVHYDIRGYNARWGFNK